MYTANRELPGNTQTRGVRVLKRSFFKVKKNNFHYIEPFDLAALNARQFVRVRDVSGR
jgi:hypothetical protein